MFMNIYRVIVWFVWPEITGARQIYFLGVTSLPYHEIFMICIFELRFSIITVNIVHFTFTE